MFHAELVQTATDLLWDNDNPAPWVPRYDAALASDSESDLELLVNSLVEERPVTNH